jgi:beta-phosphoglucomutase-like phosphatase (HAD superfamily)
MAHPQTFLFDLDDTLVASGTASWIACTELVNDILRNKGVRRSFTSEELARRGIGMPIDAFLSEQAAEHNFTVSADELQHIHAAADIIIREYFRQNLRPIPAVCQALAQLQRQNCPIGIVTSSSLDWIDVCIEAAQIKEFFHRDLIFSARALGVKVKPDPAVYLQALSCVSDTARVVAVEDSISGVKAASLAAVPMILGCTAFLPKDMKAEHAQHLRELGACGFFDSWEEFSGIIRKHGVAAGSYG